MLLKNVESLTNIATEYFSDNDKVLTDIKDIIDSEKAETERLSEELTRVKKAYTERFLSGSDSVEDVKEDVPEEVKEEPINLDDIFDEAKIEE